MTTTVPSPTAATATPPSSDSEAAAAAKAETQWLLSHEERFQRQEQRLALLEQRLLLRAGGRRRLLLRDSRHHDAAEHGGILLLSRTSSNNNTQQPPDAIGTDDDDSANNTTSNYSSSSSDDDAAAMMMISPPGATTEHTDTSITAAWSDDQIANDNVKSKKEGLVVPSDHVDKTKKNKGDDEKPPQEGDDELVNALSEDVYTFLYVSPICSPASLYAMAVILLQLAFNVLIVVDAIGLRYTKLAFPVTTTPIIATAQGICMLVVVAYQADMREAIDTLHRGYHQDQEPVVKAFPVATYERFLTVQLLKLLLGGFLLANVFIRMMFITNVISVFLIVPMTTFVSMIANIGFSVAHQGILTPEMRELCEKCKKVKHSRFGSVKNYICPRLFYLLILSGIMTGYFIIVLGQFRGNLLCQRVYAQFGDDFRSSYAGFSGEYVLAPGWRFDGRVVYLQEKKIDGGAAQSQSSMLAYCKAESAWTHSSWTPGGISEPDPCRDWNLKSEGGMHTSYDILDAADAVWVAQTSDDHHHVVYPLSRSAILCHDCTGGTRGTCNEQHGTCVDNQCVCHAGRYGYNCIFSDPCPSIELDRRSGSFPIPAEGEAMADRFEILRGNAINLLGGEESVGTDFVRVNRHPVYVNTDDMTTFDILMFTGRRWIMTKDVLLLKSFANQEELISFLTEEFHPVFSSYGYTIASQPLDVGSVTYLGTPLGLAWYDVPWRGQMNTTEFDSDVNSARALDAQFVCAVCDDTTNPCQNDHECSPIDHTCTCRRGYHGSLCEGVDHCHDTKAPCYNTGVCQRDGTCSCSTIPGEPESASRYYGSFCEFDAFEGHLEWRGANGGSASWHDQSLTCGCSSTLQVEYRGTINVTKSGLPCQKWDAHDPNEHIFTAENFPKAGLDENYCRNPANFEAASCYTMDDNITFEECAVPECPPELCPPLEKVCGCESTAQTEYRGTLSVTKSGLTCQRWGTQGAPHIHPQVTPELYPDDGLEENYCRNPGRELGTAWCYTTHKDVLYEECNVHACPQRQCPDL